MNKEQIDIYRIGLVNYLDRLDTDSFNSFYKKYKDFEHSFTKQEMTVLIGILIENINKNLTFS